MQIEVYPKTVFSCPLYRFQKVPATLLNQLNDKLMMRSSYVHAVFARYGSPVQVSTAQNGIGRRIQLSPAPYQ